jgi:ParB-like nuclease domain
MRESDEIDALADDRAANGQQHPIVIDTSNGSRQIIDGRNRLEACRRRGIEPVFEELDGRDPVALILSQNVNRRHMTKDAVAIAVALQFQEPAKAYRGKKGSVSQPFPMVDKARLSEARLVVGYSPALAKEVLAGKMGLDRAYEETRKQIIDRAHHALRGGRQHAFAHRKIEVLLRHGAELPPLR